MPLTETQHSHLRPVPRYSGKSTMGAHPMNQEDQIIFLLNKVLKEVETLKEELKIKGKQ
jgi:hypothetical protein